MKKSLKRLNISKRGISLFFFLIIGSGFLFGQDIITADRFMEMVSERYSTIRDFEADIAIRSGNTDMMGAISYLAPSFIRIDFSRPADQVIVFNGEQLTVHLPEFRATLSQNISRRAGSSGTAQGLTLLRRNYVPSFVTGPNPEPLYANSREMVVRVRLTRRFVSEGFREIIISVNPDTRIIRRMEGRTIADGEVRFDFTNVRVNQGIPEARFLYDSPPAANMFHNFLFRDTD
jgi:outer membrane lipoprotein-sorting protein